MTKTAVLFGSIGTIMETSDVQRRAYNLALHEAGLPWVWDRDVYADLLEQSGGKDRLATLSAATAGTLTPAQIDAIHARKTELACAEITNRRLAPRPGVVELIALAQARGMQLGFVTTTYRVNIDAIFAALGDRLDATDFAYIGDRDAVNAGKPAPDAFGAALTALGIGADAALAIEDTALSVMSAKRAGIATIATPGALTAQQDFWQADLVVPALARPDGTLDPRVLAMLG